MIADDFVVTDYSLVCHECQQPFPEDMLGECVRCHSRMCPRCGRCTCDDQFDALLREQVGAFAHA